MRDDLLKDAEAAFRRPKRALMRAQAAAFVVAGLAIASAANLLVLLSR